MADDKFVHIFYLGAPTPNPTPRMVCGVAGYYLRRSRDHQLRDVTCAECLDVADEILRGQLAHVEAAREALIAAARSLAATGGP